MTRIVAILGPTASGKTDVAISVAAEMGAEVISVDSMQVYRGMDIGTAKPTVIDRKGIPHHMIDLVDPSEDFSAASFASTGRGIIDAATTPLVISGGSGLHFRALVDPMSFAPTDPALRARLESDTPESISARLLEIDPEAGDHVDMANHRRAVRALEIYQLTGETPSERARTAEAEDLRRYVSRVGFTAVGIDPGDQLESRVDLRLAEMRSGGLIEEVANLWAGMGRSARSAVGYRQIGDYLEGAIELDTALADASRMTKRLARKQRTWFHRDPRIRWIPWDSDPSRLTRRVMEAL